MTFAFHEQVLDNLPDGITIQDKNFNIIYQNKAMKHAFGEHVGMKCYAIYERRDEVCEGCGVQKAFRTGEANIVLRTAFEVDGKTSYWENACFPLFDTEGNTIAGVEVCRNITDRVSLEEEVKDRNIELGQLNKQLKNKTAQLMSALTQHEVAEQNLRKEIEERKRVEAALRESEEKYRTQFEEALDAIFVGDAETGVIIDCNQAALQLVGREKSDLVGKHHQILHPPEEIDGKSSRTLKQHLKEKQGQALETRVITKSREIRDVSIKASVFTLKGKKVLQGIFRDVTEWKRTQEEKKKLELQLQQAYKMEAIGTLAGGIAHDFNNILAAMIGYTELARGDLPKHSRTHSNLKEVYKAGLRAKNLVQQILTFSRQRDEEKMPLRVSPIIKEALKLLRASLPATIEIRQKIPSQSDTILGDPTQIHQVLMNLCANAEYAMREHGGVLEVRLLEERLDPGAASQHLDLKPGAYVRLTVSDTGCGMDSKIVDRIFDPYFTTKELSQGTGMGLAVVHGIVKSHGGSIMVTSTPDKGTTFDVFLPRIETEQAGEADAIRLTPRGTERILFVDDERGLADIGGQILADLGYDVVARTSSVEALEAFRAQPDRFDLVITDQTMPNMTGADLAQELMQIRPDIPVILCTGYSYMISKEEAKAIGIREYVMKPIVSRDMAEVIRKVLDA
jgi:two-component system cell cycle sensor histidine kinase/response regulator CckA